MSTPASSTPASSETPSSVKKHYLVLFVTDYRKEHDFRAHKTFLTMEAAIEEAKKFTDPPKDYAKGDEDDEDDDGPFQWEYTCPSSKILFAEKCHHTYEGAAVANMSWTPVVTVVEVDFEER